MNQTDTIRQHRKSLAEMDGVSATFEVPLTYIKSFVGNYTTSMGDIKKGRIIEGIASTEDMDQQGEIVVQDKMDCSYLLEKGYLNWNHSHSPEDQIGKPLEVIKLAGGPSTPKGLPCTFFRALLFESMPRAEAAWTLSKALEESAGVGEDRHLGFSVEGGVRVRHNNILMETMVRHMAATHEPVNAQAVARCVLAKSQGFKVDDSVLIDTLDDNVPHFIFKSFSQLSKSLLFSKNMMADASSGGPMNLGDAKALLTENLSVNGHGRARHKNKARKSFADTLYSECIHGNTCKSGDTFKKGYQGALDHLVYCGGMNPVDAANALLSHIRMLKSN